MLYKKSIIVGCFIALALAIAAPKHAQAVDGPLDGLALASTASLILVTGFSAWNWYHKDDPKSLLNLEARIAGRDGWVDWYANHVEMVTIGWATLSAIMMKQFCTRLV